MLVSCPDCGKQISDSAPSCIGCGRPMHPPTHHPPPPPSPTSTPATTRIAQPAQPRGVAPRPPYRAWGRATEIERDLVDPKSGKRFDRGKCPWCHQQTPVARQLLPKLTFLPNRQVWSCSNCGGFLGGNPWAALGLGLLEAGGSVLFIAVLAILDTSTKRGSPATSMAFLPAFIAALDGALRCIASVRALAARGYWGTHGTSHPYPLPAAAPAGKVQLAPTEPPRSPQALDPLPLQGRRPARTNPGPIPASVKAGGSAPISGQPARSADGTSDARPLGTPCTAGRHRSPTPWKIVLWLSFVLGGAILLLTIPFQVVPLPAKGRRGAGDQVISGSPMQDSDSVPRVSPVSPQRQSPRDTSSIAKAPAYPAAHPTPQPAWIDPWPRVAPGATYAPESDEVEYGTMTSTQPSFDGVSLVSRWSQQWQWGPEGLALSGFVVVRNLSNKPMPGLVAVITAVDERGDVVAVLRQPLVESVLEPGKPSGCSFRHLVVFPDLRRDRTGIVRTPRLKMVRIAIQDPSGVQVARWEPGTTPR